RVPNGERGGVGRGLVRARALPQRRDRAVGRLPAGSARLRAIVEIVVTGLDRGGVEQLAVLDAAEAVQAGVTRALLRVGDVRPGAVLERGALPGGARALLDVVGRVRIGVVLTVGPLAHRVDEAVRLGRNAGRRARGAGPEAARVGRLEVRAAGRHAAPT